MHPVYMPRKEKLERGSAPSASQQQEAGRLRADIAAAAAGRYSAFSAAGHAERPSARVLAAEEAAAKATQAADSAAAALRSMVKAENPLAEAAVDAHTRAEVAVEGLRETVYSLVEVYDDNLFDHSKKKIKLATFKKMWAEQRKDEMEGILEAGRAAAADASAVGAVEGQGKLPGYVALKPVDPLFKHAVKFYDKVLPTYSTLTERERTLSSFNADTSAAYKDLQISLRRFDMEKELKAIELCLVPKALHDALDPGVTAAVRAGPALLRHVRPPAPT